MSQKKITEVIPRYASDSVYQIINERRVGDIKEFRFKEMRKGKKHSNAVVLTDKNNRWLAAADWFYGESVIRDEAAAQKIVEEYKRENIKKDISKMEEGCPTTKGFLNFFLEAISPAIIYIAIITSLFKYGILQEWSIYYGYYYGCGLLIFGAGMIIRLFFYDKSIQAFDWDKINSLKALRGILDEAEDMTQSTNSIANGIMVS